MATMGHSETSLALKVLGALAVVAVLGLGSWLIISYGPGVDLVRIGLTVVFFIVVSALIARASERRPDLKTPLRVVFLAVAIAGGSLYVWDTYLRPKSEANEQVATGAVKASEVREQAPDGNGGGGAGQNVELASGSFGGLTGHSAEGRVSVVELAGGGTRLVFEDFEVTQGPDLRVYLVEGDDVSGDNFEDAGSLKAEKGRFQYSIDDVDTDRYSTVVIWCRAFSTPFGSAPLEGS